MSGQAYRTRFFDEVENIVIDRNEVRADVVRRLLLRGLAAYRRDGLLDELL